VSPTFISLRNLIPTRNCSDPNERAYFWLPDSNLTTTHELLDTPTAERMYIDQSEIVRVRVEADEFYDYEPGPPKAAEGVKIERTGSKAPYTIIVR
jgi:DNA-directed RNA polymerase III subunit RPC8